MAANAQEKGILGEGSEIIVEQLEHLLKNILGGHKILVNNAHSEDEADNNFSGMVSCFSARANVTEWIIDSGASDHMTGNVKCVTNPRALTTEYKINLPDGETSKITHCGTVNLENGLSLKEVPVVPKFKHSLLSV